MKTCSDNWSSGDSFPQKKWYNGQYLLVGAPLGPPNKCKETCFGSRINVPEEHCRSQKPVMVGEEKVPPKESAMIPGPEAKVSACRSQNWKETCKKLWRVGEILLGKWGYHVQLGEWGEMGHETTHPAGCGAPSNRCFEAEESKFEECSERRWGRFINENCPWMMQ